jgi:hypothetical protein
MKRMKSVRNITMPGILSAALLTPLARAKEKINRAAGLGFHELANVEVRFQARHNTRQAALSLEFAFPHVLALTGDMFFHFGGNSGFSERKPWYVREGLRKSLIQSGLFCSSWCCLIHLRF